MESLISQAVQATREAKHIEFKSSFDPSSAADWCELTKDLVAIANSGGGIVVFGLDSFGNPVSTDVTAILKIDPADLLNKTCKYVGAIQLEIEIVELEKSGKKLAGFIIKGVDSPVVFQRPGTYDLGNGKQKSAFGTGSIYLRHGAKSEPATAEDVRKLIDRRVAAMRKLWTQSLRKVIEAPQGAEVIIARPARNGSAASQKIRVVSDPNATPVYLTRDEGIADGVYLHEGVSEQLFDEVNNVIDANRVLAKGQDKFYFGPTVYYRIYAERKHVKNDNAAWALLFHAAVFDFYAPCFYWVRKVSAQIVTNVLADVYLHPRNYGTLFLIRFVTLVGGDWATWLEEKWNLKWKRHSQPPSYFWAFQRAQEDAKNCDRRLVATKMCEQTRVEMPGAPTATVATLLEHRERAKNLLSYACLQEFEKQGKTPEFRRYARALDCLSYSDELTKRAAAIFKPFLAIVGDQGPGDPQASTETE